MDDDSFGRQSPNPADPTADPKHLAMINRLSALHQSRIDNAAARRESSEAPAFQSLSGFLQRFADTQRSINSQILNCRFLAQTLAPSELKSQLNNVANSIADLDRLVAENSYFLPPYELRSSLKSISDLKENLESLNSEILPRKKFSFRNKAVSKDPAVLLKAIDGGERPDEKPRISMKEGIGRESPGFRNRRGVVLAKDFRVSEEGDFSLVDLCDCEVYLRGRIRALFMHRIVNCKVFAGPVLGSILIEEVSGSVLMLASHQVRIHEAKATDFYLRVRSRPIIEDSSGVRFAPYMVFYQGIDEDLKVSGLGEETGNWANVDDFKWLRAVQSPNWSLIPEEELLAIKDISDVEEECQDI